MGCELDIGTRYEYDSLNRVSAIRHLQCEDTPAYHREAYTYNAASMRTRIDVEKANGGSMLMPDSHKLYKYDALLRLTEEHKRRAGDNVSLYRFAYNYDAAGNRTQLVNFTGATTQTTTYQYNNGNQLTSYGGPWTDGYSFAYDLNGNQINKWFEDDHTVTNHNRENRLTSVYRTVTGHTVSYTYDALGRRIMRTDPQGNKVRYWYDGLGILLTKEKPSGASAWRTKQIYTLKQAALGHIISERTNTAWNAQGAATAWGDKWFHFDLLGNTTAELNSVGIVAAQVDMEAFGTVLSGGQNGYRLTTKQYDPDAGLYYFNARWYCASVAGFHEKCPLPPSSESPYNAFFQRPTMLVDPTGLLPVHDAISQCKSGCPDWNCCSFVRCVISKLGGQPPIGHYPRPGSIVCWNTDAAGCMACLTSPGGSEFVGHIGIIDDDGMAVSCRTPIDTSEQPRQPRPVSYPKPYDHPNIGRPSMPAGPIIFPWPTTEPL
jgi:RHS repeat-associated protein